ncbi:ArsR/SmtB family transcription factor [Metallosphaera hakonensis]|uniref:Transcriptional regulator n=1 Tax=Metallosphaera hakonensis JCM 8857 = DSM 7519 TaxID=1293036 RepID=A0A2U9IWK9_9CREN|nr:helix-turn-helix domain-containing protein [Metallosphaera hakonensis]AWS00395.1 helix-turn-helix domain-containing protein [Metallosphaera hakonensis JCM 8857 = DSM 7519]
MDIYEAISNPVRRRILELLEVPMTFSELSNELALDSPSLSFHLRKLNGLVVKDQEGKYHLTDEGRRALGIIRGIDSSSMLKQVVVEYLGEVKLDNEYLLKLKGEGKKLVIRNVKKVDLTGVNSDLLSDVLEVMENVKTLLCTEETYSAIRDRIHGEVTRVQENERAKIKVKNDHGAEFHLGNFLSSILSIPRFNNLVTVYDDAITFTPDLEISLDGGMISLVKGSPHLLAQCHDIEDLDLSPGKIRADGCSLRIQYPDLRTLKIDVDGGKVSLKEVKVDSLDVEMDGGMVHLDLGNREGKIKIDGGKVDGRILYGKGNSSLSLDIEGGMADLTLSIPEGVGILTSSSLDLGLTSLPKPRQGREGTLIISTQVQGGLVKVKEGD